MSPGRFVLKKVLGKFNTADVLTKPLGHDLVQRLLIPFGVVFDSPLELGLGARGVPGIRPPKCVHIPLTQLGPMHGYPSPSWLKPRACSFQSKELPYMVAEFGAW